MGLFFSLATLTTMGYGNLVPAAKPGQSFAVLEAIVGQLFLVPAVAKVVTAWRRPFGFDKKSGSGHGRWSASAATASDCSRRDDASFIQHG
jgi:Ion channel